VFESRVLSRIFGTKRQEVTPYWRKLLNEELQNVTLPIIKRILKLRRIRGARHLARMRGKCIQISDAET
jgi:hypothetical protein